MQVVRPGFVHTKMTAGRKATPLSTGPDEVADQMMAGLATGATVVWSPPAMRWVAPVLRVIPGPLWRRLLG
jgi:decaprenylphospho-beta-D-erythro-pentofuranosid-2-ulose 2-reductase